MSESLKEIVIVLGMFIIILSFVALFLGGASEVIGETPCVDGMNRINLEGIMCEDIERTWFGQNEWLCLLVIIPALLGMFLIKLGVEQ